MAIRVRNLTNTTVFLPHPINGSVPARVDKVFEFVEFDEAANDDRIARIIKSKKIEIFSVDPLAIASGGGSFSIDPLPPLNPDPGDLWFNIDADWDVLMIYDGSRAKWTSVLEYHLGLGRASADGNLLAGYGISAPGTGTGILIPRDAVIKRLTARARSGLATKTFDLLVNGSTAMGFSLVGSQFTSNSLNIDVSQGDDVWASTTTQGTPTQDIVLIMWISWRVDG